MTENSLNLRDPCLILFGSAWCMFICLYVKQTTVRGRWNRWSRRGGGRSGGREAGEIIQCNCMYVLYVRKCYETIAKMLNAEMGERKRAT